ncbi:MAG TPA: alkyl sulfatase dimerization domain-containing protein [Ktedonobacterales bacterium]|nr:alkyl sulfatase dimerization domain-containing protein [Ktedonobacterales bacterium]
MSASSPTGATKTPSHKPRPATRPTADANARLRQTLPFQDTQDFEDARRGQLAGPNSGIIKGTGGRAVWDMDVYTFEDREEAPASVNPSLWRQARLNRISGLFQVTDGIYQVRGLDLSNMTIIEGETGLIVIDPLVSTECAAAGMDLYIQRRSRKPVVAVIYTHSHVDHYGGVKGVISEDDVRAGRVRVYAPEGFLEYTISENVFAGTAMSRRAQYQYGLFLPRGELGQVDLGLGKAVSTGSITLIPPTDIISEPHAKRTIDGVDIEFQLTPGTEAPAEMNFYFPRFRALCAAENATHNLHNILTLRGAEVRDTKAWASYLDETITLFAHRSDVLFASHHWPTWGAERIRTYLADQRDMYEYLHDQTLRLINHGYTPMEIAEALATLPPELERRWYCRGYYGSLSHNVRAVYQRYLGFYDGNPASLNPLPPVEAGKRYVEAIGGADKVLDIARASFERGEYRWAAQLLNHLVFAQPDNQTARELQANALEQMGYQSESGTWRSAYLTGAHELRNGADTSITITTANPDLTQAMPIELFFDYLGIRLNGEKAANTGEMALIWRFTDLDETHTLTLRNATLTHARGERDGRQPDATITLTRATLDAITLGQTTFDQAIADGRVSVSGDTGKLTQLLALLDTFELMFNIVEP